MVLPAQGGGSCCVAGTPQLPAAEAVTGSGAQGFGIIQWNGLDATGQGPQGQSGGGSLADQLVNSALRYRAQAPLVDSLLKELGMKADDINGLADGLKQEPPAPH